MNGLGFKQLRDLLLGNETVREEVIFDELVSYQKRLTRRVRQLALFFLILYLLLFGIGYYVYINMVPRVYSNAQSVAHIASRGLKTQGVLLYRVGRDTVQMREGALISGRICRYLDESGLNCDITLPPDQDNQTLYFNTTNNRLYISGGNSVDLSSLVDIYTAGSGLTLADRQFGVDAPTCTEGEKLVWDGDQFVCKTDLDQQQLVFDSSTGRLEISSGNTVDLSVFWDNTDSQVLDLVGSILSISGGNSVDLSAFLDNTDDQQLSWDPVTNQLTIEDGNTVNLSDLQQTLAFDDSTYRLSISDGNTVDLSVLANIWEAVPYDGTNATIWGGNALKPNVPNKGIVLEDNSNGITTLRIINRNDSDYYAGAALVLKGSGADYRNQLYFGILSSGFYQTPFRNKALLKTRDRELWIGTHADTDLPIRFFGNVRNPGWQPEFIATFSTSGVYFNSLERIGTLPASYGVIVSDLSDGGRLVAVSPGDIINASNGLTKVGNTIELGGVLTHNTLISTGANLFGVIGTDGTVTNGSLVSSSFGAYMVSQVSGTHRASIKLNDGMMTLAAGDSGQPPTTITMYSGNYPNYMGRIIVYGYSGTQFKGIEYAGDYSSLFTDRSLVDKAYVDNAILGAIGSIDTSRIHDADNDTFVAAEQNPDEDYIRFATGGNERMVIDSQGRVGIGTSTPTYALDLKNGGNIVAKFTGSGSFTRLVVDGSSSNVGIRYMVGGNKTWSSAAYQGNLGNIDYTVWNEQLGDAAIFIDGDSNNVGLGTLSPTQRLEVRGNIRIDNSSNSAVNTLLQTLAGGIFQIDTHRNTVALNSTGSPAFSPFSGTELSLDPNVGSVRVLFSAYEVQGGAWAFFGNNMRISTGFQRFDSTREGWGFILDGRDTYSAFKVAYVGSLGTSATSKLAIRPDGSMLVGDDIGANPDFTRPNILYFDGALGYMGINRAGPPDRRLEVVDSSNPQLRLTNTPVASFAEFFVDGTGNLFVNSLTNSNQLVVTSNNRIGIGTASPTHKLQVSGSIRASGFLGAFGTASTPSYRFYGDSNTGIFRPVADTIGFSTGGTERLRIDSAGNIGVNTDAPTARLHIYDNTLGGELLKVESQYISPGLVGYQYKRPITLSWGGSSDLTDYQVVVRFDSASLIAAGKMQADCDDIRFTTDDGMTLLPYWIESGCNTTTTIVWVRVPLIPAGGSALIYMYYGAPTATSTADPEAVFDFYDDFNGTAVDITKWSIESAGYTIGGGVLQINVGALGLVSVLPYSIQDGYIVETRVMHPGNTGGYGGTIPEVASSAYTAGSNSNADATILYMRQVGSVNVALYVGDGSSTGYNVVGGSTMWTSSNGTWYVTAVGVSGNRLDVLVDGSVVYNNNTVNWAKQLRYIRLGAFTNSTTYDIQDTQYDWVRIRKYVGGSVSVSVGAEQPNTNIRPVQVNFVIKNGLVGIHTDNPLYALQVGDAGDGAVAISNAWLTFSDRRWKENITLLTEALDTVLALRPVHYNWRDSGKPDVGFVAQEVRDILPDIVYQDANGFYSIDYTKLTPYLVRAIQELNDKISSISGVDSYWTLESGILSSPYPLNVSNLSATELNATSITGSVITASTFDVGAGALSIDSNGNVVSSGSITATNINATQIRAKEIETAHITIKGQFAGRFTMPAGVNIVRVNVPNLKADDIVLVTLLGNSPVPYSVTVRNGSFTVFIQRPVTRSLEFNYFIVTNLR